MEPIFGVGKRGSAWGCPIRRDERRTYQVFDHVPHPRPPLLFFSSSSSSSSSSSFLTNTIESWIAAPLNNIDCFTSQLLNHLPTSIIKSSSSLALNQSHPYHPLKSNSPHTTQMLSQYVDAIHISSWRFKSKRSKPSSKSKRNHCRAPNASTHAPCNILGRECYT